MRSISMILCGVLVAVGLGCNNSSKSQAGRSAGVVINSATASPNKVAPGATFNLNVAAATSATAVYNWTQEGGPTAIFTSGTTTSSVSLTSPASGNAGWMEFQIEVKSGPTGPPAYKDVFVLYNGVHQHNIALVYNVGATGSPDSVTATLTRLDGTAVDGTKQVSLTYKLTLTSGSVDRVGNLLPPSFTTTTSFGTDSGGQPISLAAGNISNMSLELRENGVLVDTITISGGPASRTYP